MKEKLQNGTIVLWVTAGIFLLFIGAVVWSGAYIRGHQSAIQGIVVERAKNATNEKHYKKCFKLPTIQMAKKCISNSPEVTADEIRANEDLNAQTRMADWTEAMFWITGVASLIGALGLYIVYRTLQATQQMNEITQKAFLSERRPWLFIKNEMVGELTASPFEHEFLDYDCDIEWGFNYWLKNTGKTTAHVTEIRHMWICGENWFEAREYMDELIAGRIGNKDYSRRPVFAGEELKFRPSTGGDLIKKSSPESRFFSFIICVKYTDGEGNMEGVDARCFHLQQDGPDIGPWITQYKSDESARIIK